MKIVVLAGGYSPERNVSLASGAMVANSLIKSGHQVLLLDLYLGVDCLDKDYDSLFRKNKNYETNVDKGEVDLESLKKEYGDSLIGKNVIELCKYADIVYMALHGGIGESGKLQNLFDLLNIKYTGSNPVGCMLAMDKLLTKKILKSDNILTPNWIVYKEGMNIDEISLPAVIKPSNLGSSIGISIAFKKQELKRAIDEALKWDKEVLIEDFIVGREFSCGIVGDRVLPVIEIIPKTGFYDYKTKYTMGEASEICPALISLDTKEQIQKMTKDVCHSLQITKYARVDFILSSDNKLYCLEANVLPGMTKTSLLPQEAVADNLNYEMLLEKIISL